VKKVAIVGCSQSKMLAPFGDEEFEIWGVNNLYPHIPRATRWFEIHNIEKKGDDYYRREDIKFRGQVVKTYLEKMGRWCQERNCPVYMQQVWDIVPTSVQYPLGDILNVFGGYFTNTVSYMLALAIYEQFEEIHVYGVDMAVDTEYHHQRPSCEYFLGVAVGRGIKVYIPAEADLLKTRFLYGFEEAKKTAWEKKQDIIHQTMEEKRQKKLQEIAFHEQAIKLANNEVQQYLGAAHALKETRKIWS